MAFYQPSNRWLWFTLGVAAFVAGKAIQHVMSDIISLTAIDRQPSPVDKSPIEDQPEGEGEEDTISLPTLHTLSSHPNHRIATAARTLIVHKFETTPGALHDLRQETYLADPKRRKRAKLAMKFLEEWGVYDYRSPSGVDFEEEEDDGDETEDEGTAIAMEVLTLRDTSGDSLERLGLSSQRLTSLTEQLGVEERDQGEEAVYRRLLGNVRVLEGVVPEDDEEEDDDGEGHWMNARQLGISNFTGLSHAPRDPGLEEIQEIRWRRMRARREAAVMGRPYEPDEQGQEEEISLRWYAPY